jgi:hypothetical protein
MMGYIVHVEMDGRHHTAEMYKWLRASIKRKIAEVSGRYMAVSELIPRYEVEILMALHIYKAMPISFKFEDENDALLFKLTWG